MPHAAPPIRVNRAPVLTLWASIVAERLGHPPETALSLASAVAGTAAHAKARRLGLQEAAERDTPDKGRAAPRQSVPLLGHEVPVVRDRGGVLLAAGRDGKPALPRAVEVYLQRAFGERLAEAQRAMRELAASYPPDEINRIGFRLYEAFRPDVPEGVRGWGAKGMLDLARISLQGRHGAGTRG